MPKQNQYKKEDDELQKRVKELETNIAEGKPKKYNYTYVGMETVMQNPAEYIIPELLEACKMLWSMNIFTFMCSNREDYGHSYILLEKLSDENQAIFDEIRKKHPKNFIYSQYRKCFGIDFYTENLSEQEIVERFEKAINHFVPQDIQNTFYLTREQFLLDCGCYKEVPNPKYVENPGPMPMGTDLSTLDEWFEKCHQPKLIKEFDESKVIKPIEEYLKEKGVTTYDPKTKRIYQSEFFLKRHLEFEKRISHTKEGTTLVD